MTRRSNQDALYQRLERIKEAKRLKRLQEFKLYAGIVILTSIAIPVLWIAGGR